MIMKNSTVPGAVFAVQKSDLQIKLEREGHIFRGQEPLSLHVLDKNERCFCRLK